MDNRGLKIGITGGIGSGKSTVCRVFSTLGIPVFAADQEARKIMESDPEVMDKVRRIAGRDVYSEGNLDRPGLAALIFNDSLMLEKINGIVHPVVRRSFELWLNQQDSEYVILEAAILFESGSFSNMDRIITVTAPREERIDRVVKRNGLTREQIIERMNNQTDDDYKISRSDFVIDNSDNKLIVPEILKIHSEILRQVNLRKKNG